MKVGSKVSWSLGRQIVERRAEQQRTEPTPMATVTSERDDERPDRGGDRTDLGPLRLEDRWVPMPWVRLPCPGCRAGPTGDPGPAGRPAGPCRRRVRMRVVLHRLRRHLHERLLQRGALRRSARAARAGARAASSPISSVLAPSISSVPSSASTDGEARPRAARRCSRSCCGERSRTKLREFSWMKSAIEVFGEQPSLADHDQVLGGQRHFAHQMAGDEDRPALGREGLHQIADPVDALGVQTVDRLVEHQDLRDRRAAPHAIPSRCPIPSEKPFDFLLRHRGQPDDVEHLVDPARRGCGCSARDTAGCCTRCGRRAWPSRPAARRCTSAAPRARGSACRRSGPIRWSGCPGRASSAWSSTCPRRWVRGSPSPHRACTWKERWSTAVLLPKRLVSPSTSIMRPT